MLSSKKTIRSWSKEVVPVMLVAVTVALMAFAWQRERGEKPFFYQEYYEPAIRMACGQPFGIDLSGKITDEMKRFLKVERQTLSCESVTPATTLEKYPPQRNWYHLFFATAQIWKVTGISWSALDGFAAALLAIAAVMLFALFRLLMPMPFSAALAIISIVPGLSFMPYLRDLNKAPFILAALFVATWLVVRTPTRLRLLGVMAGLGVWLGIGYGFRPDVLILLPLLIVTIIFFRPARLKSGWRDNVLAVTVLLLTFIVAASPVFTPSNANVGTCTWHFGLLGLSDSHTSMLGVTPANYSWLSHFNDELVWRSVESYGERTLLLPSVGYCTPLYDQVSKTLYLEIIRTFPADFITRGLAAGHVVIGYGVWGFPWAEVAPNWGAFLESHRAFVQGTLVAGWAAVLLAALLWNVRVGLFLVFALAYLGSYPAIQFDQRHYFHLAFLSWLPAGLILGWMVRASISVAQRKTTVRGWALSKLPGTMAWVRATVVVIGVFGALYAIYLAAHHEQTLAVQRVFERYLKAAGDQVVVTSQTIRGEDIAITIAPPERDDQNKLNGRMFRLDLGGPDCALGTKKIVTELSGSDRNYVFKKEFAIDLASNEARAIIVFPVYFQQGRLTTLMVNLPKDVYAEKMDVKPNRELTELTVISFEENLKCLRKMEWLRTDELPSLWVSATLYPDWSNARFYQRH